MPWVFGYGSLLPAGVTALPEGAVPGRLSGWRRGWGGAMDNPRDIRGYKHYRTPDGERPDVMVVFLDIAPHTDGLVNGVAIRVDEEELPGLDRRERNYRRVDVSDSLDTPLPGGGRVWAYAGRRESRERAAIGRRERRRGAPRGGNPPGPGRGGGAGAPAGVSAPLLAPVADLVLVRHAPGAVPRATAG